ncbi:MAG TPA: hypothetical protein VKQ08_09665 [Cyclobacteriaceae bacterium]|nr:hypothetical protein [Cyclobacteriaceae bacterium]
MTTSEQGGKMPISNAPTGARIITQLRNFDDWKQLLDGCVDAICLKEFASPRECAELLTFVIHHPRSKNYTTAAGIVRLGSSFSDVRKTGKIQEEYSKSDILEEASMVNPVIPRLFEIISTSWPFGLETFTYRGLPLHRSIARRMVGGGAEPHDDNIAKELADDLNASTVRAQLGLNLYIEVPINGGQLEGWHRRLTQSEYDSLRNQEPKLNYGVRRDAIGACDWMIKPTLGELIIFQNSELHAVCKSTESRATWGFFLGYRGDNYPLLVWS